MRTEVRPEQERSSGTTVTVSENAMLTQFFQNLNTKRTQTLVIIAITKNKETKYRRDLYVR